ncbi:MAG: hypothetical protein ACOC2H_04260 [Spirochaetota bacterium]
MNEQDVKTMLEESGIEFTRLSDGTSVATRTHDRSIEVQHFLTDEELEAWIATDDAAYRFRWTMKCCDEGTVVPNL